MIAEVDFGWWWAVVREVVEDGGEDEDEGEGEVWSVCVCLKVETVKRHCLVECLNFQISRHLRALRVLFPLYTWLGLQNRCRPARLAISLFISKIYLNCSSIESSPSSINLHPW